MNRILVSICLVALSGCTRIAVTHPVGKAVPAAELDEALSGEWIGGKGVIWTVSRPKDSAKLHVAYPEDGKNKEAYFLVTQIADDVSIVWVDDKELDASLPLRVSGGDDALTLLYPDEEEIKRLVGEKKITGSYDEPKKAWILSDQELEPFLVQKAFWRLDVSMPFVRTKKSARPPDSTPPAAPAEQRPEQRPAG